ncbi:MAG: helix-turn-helix domain-containing protein [Acidimicrobiales bacterium]|nr:helix-turn-helix domain-containing protein [Acidimicrobiales bacterium]
MPTLLTSKAVQQLLNVDRSTIYRMAEDGRLPAIKVGRQWRFHAEAIEQWFEDRSGGSARPGWLSPPALESRFDPVSTQALSDLVADLWGVMVVVTDMEGRAFGRVSNPCGLHVAIGNHPLVARHQIEEPRKLCATSGLTSHLMPSYLGLLCARSFIRIGTELAGMVIAGGIRPEEWPPPSEQMSRLTERLDLPFEDLAPHMDEV